MRRLEADDGAPASLRSPRSRAASTAPAHERIEPGGAPRPRTAATTSAGRPRTRAKWSPTTRRSASWRARSARSASTGAGPPPSSRSHAPCRTTAPAAAREAPLLPLVDRAATAAAAAAAPILLGSEQPLRAPRRAHVIPVDDGACTRRRPSVGVRGVGEDAEAAKRVLARGGGARRPRATTATTSRSRRARSGAACRRRRARD